MVNIKNLLESIFSYNSAGNFHYSSLIDQAIDECMDDGDITGIANDILYWLNLHEIQVDNKHLENIKHFVSELVADCACKSNV